MNEVKRVKCLDLFSGIGMFSYALKEVFETVLFCENDLGCQRVLQHNMTRGRIDTAPLIADIHTLNRSTLKSLQPSAITAGFPCQDVSLANPYGLGLRGDRSGLVYEVFRLIDELKSIQIVFLENSPVILKRGIECIIDELLSRGFEVSVGVFSAEDCGAPQIRRRAFILACQPNISIPRITLRRLTSRWEIEPVPRVIAKTDSVRDSQASRVAIKRNCMAGNSLVPQTVIWGYTNLRLSLMDVLPVRKVNYVPLRTIRVHRTDNSIQDYQKPTAFRQRPKTVSLMKQGAKEISKTFWMTPAASPLWYQYNTLTERSAFLLSNQLFYDVETLRYVRSLGHEQSGRLDRYFYISPKWVAWLMGHPLDWTRVPLRQKDLTLEPDICNSPKILAEVDS